MGFDLTDLMHGCDEFDGCIASVISHLLRFAYRHDKIKGNAHLLCLLNRETLTCIYLLVCIIRSVLAHDDCERCLEVQLDAGLKSCTNATDAAFTSS